jgi:hypothetical protein
MHLRAVDVILLFDIYMLAYAGVCWRMLAYADGCWRMLSGDVTFLFAASSVHPSLTPQQAADEC